MTDAADEFFDAPEELGVEPLSCAATEPAFERDRRADAEEREQAGEAGEKDEDIEIIHGGPHEQEEPALERCYEERVEEAEALKTQGNTCFAEAAYAEAAALYSDAIAAAPDEYAAGLAAFHGNRAACHMCLSELEAAVEDCTTALRHNPKYVKVLLRRAQAHERLQEFEKALTDVTAALEVEPENKKAAAEVKRLQPLAEAQREKLKEEMMGKLKDLGNSLLGNFGMSLDNFKAVKDPASGSYSISFQQ